MVKGLKIENVSKVFPPNVIALEEINLEIEPGEFFVILGPSGSGKTTLLRIIAGLEVPTTGRVMIGDKVVVDVERGVFLEPRERNIGMVFQNWALYPHMTAYENIAFPLTLQKLDKEEIDRRVHEVAEALGISNLLDRKPSHMSGGQQQRIALARALVKQPDVLLLDEPFSNLDARIRVTAREFVKEVQKNLGITSILVTHDQADAFAVGDRVMVLRDGVMQQLGTPEELYNEPSNLFIANFIGDPPMNIFKLPLGSSVVEGLNLRGQLPGEISGEIYLGIRPDEAVASPELEGAHMEGILKIVEYVGSRKYGKVEIEPGITLRVLVEGASNPGDRVGIFIRRVYVFSEEGKRLAVITH